MTDAERITSAKTEYTAQLKQTGNVSFTIWLLNRAEAAEAQRDTAWSELREIRTAINADDNESTSDEVRRVVHERDELRAAFIGQVKTIEELRRQLEQAQGNNKKLQSVIVGLSERLSQVTA